jgi:hypothetical protein
MYYFAQLFFSYCHSFAFGGLFCEEPQQAAAPGVLEPD